SLESKASGAALQVTSRATRPFYSRPHVLAETMRREGPPRLLARIVPAIIEGTRAPPPSPGLLSERKEAAARLYLDFSRSAKTPREGGGPSALARGVFANKQAQARNLAPHKRAPFGDQSRSGYAVKASCIVSVGRTSKRRRAWPTRPAATVRFGTVD